MAKRRSDRQVAHSEVKVQSSYLMRVVGIVTLLPPWGPVPGENAFYQAPRGKWAHETCAGCP